MLIKIISYPHFPFWHSYGLEQLQLDEQKPPKVPEFKGHLRIISLI